MPITEMNKQGSMMLPQITFTRQRPTVPPVGSPAFERPLTPQLGYSPKLTTWQSTTSISDKLVTWSTTREPTTTLAPSTTTESQPLQTFQKVTNSDGEVLFTTAWKPNHSRKTTPLPALDDHHHEDHPHGNNEGEDDHGHHHHGDSHRDTANHVDELNHEEHGDSHHEGHHVNNHHHEGHHGHHEEHHGHHEGHHGHHEGHHGHHEEHHGHHDLEPSVELPAIPENNQGLSTTAAELSRSERLFVEINNDLAFRLYHSLLEERGTESLVFSPFSVATSLAMMFLGARGNTSWQMNALLRFDEMISFNPHLLFKNVTEALSDAETAACVKQLFVDQVR